MFGISISGNLKEKTKLEYISPAGSNLKIQLRFIDKRLHQLKYVNLI